jgi:hypothetical protein
MQPQEGHARKRERKSGRHRHERDVDEQVLPADLELAAERCRDKAEDDGEWNAHPRAQRRPYSSYDDPEHAAAHRRQQLTHPAASPGLAD